MVHWWTLGGVGREQESEEHKEETERQIYFKMPRDCTKPSCGPYCQERMLNHRCFRKAGRTAYGETILMILVNEHLPQCLREANCFKVCCPKQRFILWTTQAPMSYAGTSQFFVQSMHGRWNQVLEDTFIPHVQRLFPWFQVHQL